MKNTPEIHAAFVGFGETNTPRKIIEAKCRKASALLASLGIIVHQAGPVADDPNGHQAEAAVTRLQKATFDFLVVCIAGWIPSWPVIRVIEQFKHKPMLLWGLTGNQIGDSFVTTADQAGTTALRKPMQDMGFRFKYLANRLGEPTCKDKIIAFAQAAAAVTKLRCAKIGMAGYRDMRLYSTLYEGASLKASIGPEIEHFDLLELDRRMKALSQKDINSAIAHMQSKWIFLKQPQSKTLADTARLGLAMKEQIKERAYQAISYADVDGIKKLFKFAPAGALTYLHDILDICSIPENDALGAVTQLMSRFLTGQAAAYLEFYEFTSSGALMGVPDYVPGEIVEGRTIILPNAFGNFGEGLLNVSKLKTGEVTLARMGYNNGQYILHVITGKARQPRKWEEAGWSPPAPQLPSLEIDFDSDVEDFIQNVLGQHYILTYGNQHAPYRDLCALLDITMIYQGGFEHGWSAPTKR